MEHTVEKNDSANVEGEQVWSGARDRVVRKRPERVGSIRDMRAAATHWGLHLLTGHLLTIIFSFIDKVRV